MSKLEILPLTANRWPDLERLFGPNGAYSGCWCMYLRESAREFDANCRGGGAANRKLFRQLVAAGREPGLLAYRDGEPVGWVAVAPRDEYARVLRSPLHRPIDDQTGVWAITCFFIAKHARGHGLSDALLTAAVGFAEARGARVIEAYPAATGGKRRAQADMWRGSEDQFRRAGFEVAARRKPPRPIMRRITAVRRSKARRARS